MQGFPMDPEVSSDETRREEQLAFVPDRTDADLGLGHIFVRHSSSVEHGFSTSILDPGEQSKE